MTMSTDDADDNFPLKDLSYKIQGLIFKIQNDLGTKFQEKHYSKALCSILDKESVQYQTEVPFSIKYNDTILGNFRADIIIENKVLLELKVTDRITTDHIKQTIRYLEALNLPIAYVVNFRIRPLQIKRIVNSKASASSAAPGASA